MTTKVKLPVVGIDVGGLGVKFCAENDNHERLTHLCHHDGLNGLGSTGGASKLFKIMESGVLAVTNGKEPGAIGYTLPTRFNPATGKILTSPANLGGNDWLKTNFAIMLGERFNCKVIGANDVDSGLFAESQEGAIAKLSQNENAVSIFAGGGVGAAALIKGELLIGSTGSTAELGHVPMDPSFFYKHGGKPRECGCGGLGHIEAHGSVTALLKIFREKAVEATPDDSAHASKIGNPYRTNNNMLAKQIFELRLDSVVATMAIEEMVFALASAARVALCTYEPSVFVYGGGVMGEGEYFLNMIRKRFIALNENTHDSKLAKNIKFVLAKCGDYAGAIGAMHLAKTL